MFVAKTANRVRQHTSKEALRRIDRKIQNDLAYYSDHLDEIPRRLRELDGEWDVERVLEVNSSSITLLGLVLGTVQSRKWFFLPLAVQLFFLQHGIQGWCPPIPLLRRLGIRTQSEIETEREALKALRGDVDGSLPLQRYEFVI